MIIYLSWVDKYKTIVLKLTVDSAFYVQRRETIDSIDDVPHDAIHIGPRSHNEFMTIRHGTLPILLTSVFNQEYPVPPEGIEICP